MSCVPIKVRTVKPNSICSSRSRHCMRRWANKQPSYLYLQRPPPPSPTPSPNQPALTTPRRRLSFLGMGDNGSSKRSSSNKIALVARHLETIKYLPKERMIEVLSWSTWKATTGQGPLAAMQLVVEVAACRVPYF